MQLTFRLNDRLTVVVDGSSHTELWQKLAELDEVFGNLTCDAAGKHSDKVRFQVREVEGNKFYELVVIDPSVPELNYARKSFGVHKVGGTMFPKDKTWKKWNPVTKTEEELK